MTIVEIQCTLAKSCDYGLPMIDKSFLIVANTEDTNFLMQAEFNAIKQGLEYKQIEYDDGAKYSGYVNQQGQREGVGIRIWPDGQNERGEWHQNKLHGTAKVTYSDGETYWGEYKDHNSEGYGTEEWSSGNRYIGQYMQDVKHGYGIYSLPDGEVYQGQFK